jgi:RNA polymerase sigma-70 factor (ECF subfamily)
VSEAVVGDLGFEEIAARYRAEIQLHCYRMLGSIHDAEDLTQETLLRAWKGIRGFEGRSSVRSWLYRIATNVCLTALSRRDRDHRVLPETEGPSVDFAPLGPPANEVPWLEPYPDSALESIVDQAPGPEARYEMREAVQLAFIAAIQELPPRQRAILLLRDVLGWPASEVASLLDASVASMNSALQRARVTLGQRFPGGARPPVRAPDERERSLLDRYVKAWEDSDLDGFVALLREDAVWTMPPWRQWYVGRTPIRAFMGWVWGGERRRRHRLIPTAANRQPAFGHYRTAPSGTEWEAFAIQVLTVEGGAIARVTNFAETRFFDAFALPARVSPERMAELAPDR